MLKERPNFPFPVLIEHWKSLIRVLKRRRSQECDVPLPFIIFSSYKAIMASHMFILWNQALFFSWKLTGWIFRVLASFPLFFKESQTTLFAFSNSLCLKPN